MKNILVSNIQTVTGNTGITLSDEDFARLDNSIQNEGFKTDTMEGAVYAVALGVFDKSKLIVERNNREIDLPVVSKAMVQIYNHHLEGIPAADFEWFFNDTLEGYVEVDMTDLAFAKALVEQPETKFLFERIAELPN